MAEAPLRVAVVGLGFMGTTHIRAWYNVAGAELSAVVSCDARKLAGDLSGAGGNLEQGATQFDFSGLKRYGTLDQALADGDIDAVDLCLPTHLHAEMASRCLQAGKHVFVEKPLARTSPEAYALVREAERAGRVLMAGHVLRFFAEWQELARLLQESSVKLASFRRNCAWPGWSAWLADWALSGGAPLDLLIHDADFVLHCFGVPDRVAATGFVSQDLRMDWLSAQCSFRNGNVAVIEGGWHAAADYPFSMQFSALTPKGSCDYNSLTATAEAFDPWARQLQHFTDCCRGSAADCFLPAADSARAVRLVEIMVESRKRNGEPLPWTD